MDSFFSRYKNPLVLILVLLGQFMLLAVQVKPRLPGAAVADAAAVSVLRRGVTSVVTPPERAAHSSGLGFRGVWSSYMDLIGVKEQNQQLLAENQRLRLQESALEEDAREGERLQALLAFKEHYIDSTVPAQVIGSGGTDRGRLLYINKGSDDGIQPDMAVITPDGVVGRVRDVQSGTSQVVEINDPNSAVGALLEDTRTRGVVRGNGFGQTAVVDLMPDARIKPGQLVLTSGGDQIFPRGLPVGTVEKIVVDADSAPLVDVILKPAANLGRLEEVMVITGTGSSLSAQTKKDLAHSAGVAAALKAAAASKAADAAEAALEAQSASDILAARLPTASNVTDPDAPDAVAGSSPATADSDSAPLHPPTALHADHYTPTSQEPADQMVPGARSAPQAEGVPATDRVAHTGTAADGSTLPNPSESAAFIAAHNAALAARAHARAAAAGQAATKPQAGTASGTVPAARTGALAPGVTQHTMGAPHTAAPGATGPGSATQTRPYTGQHTAEPHSQGTQPQSGAQNGSQPGTYHRPPAATGTATPPATATHRGPVPTQVVTDGPLPASKKPPTQAPRKPTGPTVVPDDGSRPPQSNTNQGPQ